MRPGRFYGSMMGNHDRTSSADQHMEPSVVWIRNNIDRSPGERVCLTSDRYGPLQGSPSNCSHGTRQLSLVPNGRIDGGMHGGVA